MSYPPLLGNSGEGPKPFQAQAIGSERSTRIADPVRDAAIERRSTDVGLKAIDVWAFLLPAMSFVEIALIGRLKVSEILAVAMLPWLLSGRERLRVPRWFLLVWVGWLVSQVITDVAVGSAFADYSRGWAKILVTLTSFVAILALVSTPKRARLFALGLAVAGIAGYFLNQNAGAAEDPWKWALAIPIAWFLATAVSGTRGMRWPALSAVAFITFGTLNLVLGYRSLGGVALMTSTYLILNNVAGRTEVAFPPSMRRAFVGVISCLVMAISVLFLYDSAAARGLLGADAQTRYYTQSGSLGVLLGGRSESLVSTQAILDSPILGHGSWARDPKYVELLSDRLTALGYGDISTDPADIGVIPAHSYLLGAWVEGGILGGLFWLAVAGSAGWLLLNLYAQRWALMPLIVFSTTLLLWDIAFSPYGEAGRFSAPFAIALCVLAFQHLRHGTNHPARTPGPA